VSDLADTWRRIEAWLARPAEHALDLRESAFARSRCLTARASRLPLATAPELDAISQKLFDGA
jgi:hypothetical protein